MMPIPLSRSTLTAMVGALLHLSVELFSGRNENTLGVRPMRSIDGRPPPASVGPAGPRTQNRNTDSRARQGGRGSLGTARVQRSRAKRPGGAPLEARDR